MTLYILLAIVFILEFMRIGRHRIVNKFLSTETMSPHSAKLFKDVGISDMFSAKILLISGILKRADDEKYYLDLSRKIQVEKIRPIIVLVVFSLGMLVYLLFR